MLWNIQDRPLYFLLASHLTKNPENLHHKYFSENVDTLYLRLLQSADTNGEYNSAIKIPLQKRL